MNVSFIESLVPVRAVCATYPGITLLQRIFIAEASAVAALALLDLSMHYAIDAMVDEGRNEAEAMKEAEALYMLQALTDQAAYAIVRDVARFVMETWSTVEAYHHDDAGRAFVHSRNGGDNGFGNGDFADDGEFLETEAQRFPGWEINVAGGRLSVVTTPE